MSGSSAWTSPKNSMPSLYASEDVFGVTVREYLRLLVIQGYKLIVIVNGHGGENHIRVLERLAKEFTATTDARVSTPSPPSLKEAYRILVMPPRWRPPFFPTCTLSAWTYPPCRLRASRSTTWIMPLWTTPPSADIPTPTLL